MPAAYDFFVSHASEDKNLIARPLAHALQASKFRVWYDEFSLRVGDSLLQSINRGLADSRYGVVILSPAFLSKAWTQNELGGIWARETATTKVLLPVWHQVTAADVALRSPMLADRVAVLTTRGLHAVAEELVRAAFPRRVDTLAFNLSDSAPSQRDAATRTLRGLLEGGATTSDLRLFLSAQQDLIPRSGILIPGFKLGADGVADFVFVNMHGVTGPIQMDLVVLETPEPLELNQSDVIGRIDELVTGFGQHQIQEQHGFNDYLGPPYVGEYPGLLRIADRAARLWFKGETFAPGTSLDLLRDDFGMNIHVRRPDVWSVRILVIVGRRSSQALNAKHEIVDRFGGLVEVASYDRLLDDPTPMWA